VRRVLWSEGALDEFDGILAYVARDNPAAADKIADRIERRVEALAAVPTGRRGRVAGTYEQVVPGLPYIIAYALATTPAGEGTLTILRIVHGARNWPGGRWPAEG
jgi:toxin ParE1/3/4